MNQAQFGEEGQGWALPFWLWGLGEMVTATPGLGSPSHDGPGVQGPAVSSLPPLLPVCGGLGGRQAQ